MKKVFTLCVAIMASAATFAQTTLWDGEDKELGTGGDFWDRCGRTVVENTQKDDVNKSGKCLQFKITGNEWNNGSAAIGLNTSSFESKRISLMIRKDVNSNVRIEIKCNDIIKKVAAWYGGSGAWQKLYFDFSTNGVEGNPTEITIFPTTDAVDGEQTIYLDNIQIEDAPKVNGNLLSANTDNLEGVIKLSGTWLKGVCQNADGEWQKVEYNDFTKLASKISNKPANIDIRGCIVKDADINAMRGNNSNILVYADEAYEADNVVKDGTCANLVLDDTKSFMVNEDFQATKVTLNRSVNAGNNTMCLPFFVSKEDMKAASIATYKGIVDNNSVVTFEKVNEVDANVPFIAYYNKAVTEFTFTDKGVVNTKNGLGSTFVGTYTPGSAEGKYGLTTDNTFKKGGAGAKTKAFRAYLELPEVSGAKTLSLDFTDGETTGIEDATISFGNKGVKVYSLQGNLIATASSMSELHLSNGIYIINNKKVIIK